MNEVYFNKKDADEALTAARLLHEKVDIDESYIETARKIYRFLQGDWYQDGSIFNKKYSISSIEKREELIADLKKMIDMMKEEWVEIRYLDDSHGEIRKLILELRNISIADE